MRIEKLNLANFKNYPELMVDFNKGINIITGLNGAGKTNLLDAIYYLCFTKSYYQNSDSQNILHENNYFRVEGAFCKDTDPDAAQNTAISVAFMKGKKKQVDKNKVVYDKISDHIGFCPLVLIEPDDVQIIKGGSKERRKLMDTALSQVDREYLLAYMKYERTRSQRNALLKQFAERRTFDENLILGYDQQLISSGNLIYEKRKTILAALNPIFLDFYEILSGGKEKVEFHYNSVLNDLSFEECLLKNREKDRIMQRTTAGIHGDDWAFEIKDHPLKKLGSQGQQKSFLIALKLALHQYLKKERNTNPLLLLDDIFDKLDVERIEMLLKLVTGEDFGQVFITDTDGERLESLLVNRKTDYQHFKINSGKLL